MLKPELCRGLSGTRGKLVRCPQLGTDQCPVLLDWIQASLWHRMSPRTLEASRLLLMEAGKRFRDQSSLPLCLTTPLDGREPLLVRR